MQGQCFDVTNYCVKWKKSCFINDKFMRKIGLSMQWIVEQGRFYANCNAMHLRVDHQSCLFTAIRIDVWIINSVADKKDQKIKTWLSMQWTVA